MQEHEFKAKDKTVRKISRDGLTEENLHSGETVRISQRELDYLSLPGQAEDSGSFQKNRHKQVKNPSAIPESISNASLKRRNRAVDQALSSQSSMGTAIPMPDAVFLRRTLSEENETAAYEAETDTVPIEENEKITEHSSRMENIRGHPSNSKNYTKAATETSSHSRKKKQAYSKKEKLRAEGKETDASGKESDQDEHTQETSDSLGGEKKGKAKQEQRKKKSRLSFEDEDSNGMVHGAGMNITKKVATAAAASTATYIHAKGHEAEQDNAAVEGIHRAELAGEKALRYVFRASRQSVYSRPPRLKENGSSADAGGLQFEAAQETGKAAGRHAAETEQSKKSIIQRYWQKQRYKKAYQSAKKGEKTAAETTKIAQSFLAKAKSIATNFMKSHKGILGIVAAIVLIFVMASSGLSSCGAMLQGSTSTFVGTTYASDDADIYAVEAAYSRLEDSLNNQINSMESRHPGYDEYRYQVDEISHNPYHLISYFTALYGDFTYVQVADQIEEIFRQQYGLAVDETREIVTETRTVRVGESLGQVVTSGYCSCTICCGIWSGGPTASGVYPTANHTIAVDASNPFVPMGTHIVMNGVEYVVEDTGAFDRYGVQFDVYYGDHASASAHGHQTWEAYIADSNGSQEVEVTSTREVNRLDVTLSNHSLDAVLRSRMDENEKKRYELYNTTYGNRNYLFDVDSLPSYGNGGFGYEIPAEALSDEKFARMIREAEKYLGYPYVWGGASPSTSFDCSGFVCWVINNCGNGWNVGRVTAEDLRSHCAYVSPGQAKPGDLIFFQGTYNTSGASHIGIYVGDNMMIHCGNPIQYANINSAYWQEHFMAFGRIQ